ncbi:MAG: hypothetical protein AN484_20305, partial [Aphanizomenon flos-aquae WA102]
VYETAAETPLPRTRPGTSPPSADPAVSYPIPDLTGMNLGASNLIQDPAQARRPQAPPPLPPAVAAGATPLRKEPSCWHEKVVEEETRERTENVLRAKEQASFRTFNTNVKRVIKWLKFF